MNFEFMTIDTPLPPCMPFPRALTGFPVSSTAKVMYCRMLDAMLDCFCVHCATNRVFEYTNSEVHEDTGIMRMSVFDDGNPKVRRPKREEQFRRYLNKRYAMTYRCTRDMMNFPHGLKMKRKIFKSWSMLENGQKQKRQKHLSITMKSLNLF